MKKYYHIILFGVSCFSSVMTVNAETFTDSQGIVYNIIESPSSEDEFGSCEVGDNRKYSAQSEIAIPATILHDDKEYKVVGISGYAFGGSNEYSANQNLKVVDLSNSIYIEYIKGYAFGACASLISIGSFESCKSLQEIGQYAFSKCYKLSSIDGLSNNLSLKKIGNYAFEQCYALQSVDLSGCSELTDIGSFVFSDCYSVSSYNLSGCSNLRRISDRAFRMSVDVYYKSVIPSFDFSGCYSISSISTEAFHFTKIEFLDISDFAENLNSIGDQAFDYCSDLQEIKGIEKCVNLESIGRSAFEDCYSLKYFDCSKWTELNWVGTQAFRNCYEISSALDFSNCKNLKEIPYKDNSHAGAFYNCYNIPSISFPESLTYIVYVPQNECLETCISYPTVPPSHPTYTAIFNDYQRHNTILFVPEEAIEAYRADSSWGIDNIMAIGEISQLNLPASINVYNNTPVELTLEYAPRLAPIPEIRWEVETEGVIELSLIDNNPTHIQLKPLSEGICTIKATNPISGIQVQSDVVVTHIAPTSLTLNITETTLELGDSIQLSAELMPEELASQKLTWESSNPEIASVSDTGVVKANSNGTVDISVVYGELSATCTVTVLEGAGVESLSASHDAKVSIYSIEGILIKADCQIDEIENLPKGIYIIISGTKRYKIIH